MNDTNEQTPSQPGDTGAAAGATMDADTLQRQRDDYYDRLLRQTADFDNYRKRVERDRLAMSESIAADIMRELLPLVDDLERALRADAGSEAAEAYRRGVELIHRQLVDTLKKRGVRVIDSIGTDFDPHFHQAVSYEHVDGKRDGEVIEEFGRGYMLGDRLLRPAMVKVAKGG